jgi:hypothetical protein
MILSPCEDATRLLVAYWAVLAMVTRARRAYWHHIERYGCRCLIVSRPTSGISGSISVHLRYTNHGRLHEGSDQLFECAAFFAAEAGRSDTLGKRLPRYGGTSLISIARHVGLRPSRRRWLPSIRAQNR